MTQESKPLLIETRGQVLVLTLNRPEAKNAFNAALSQALSDALDHFEADPTSRVAVLTGAGGNFSAGMDLKALLKGEQSATPKRGGFGIMARPPEKPLIAAIEGYAVAGGMELALCCDLIVATSTAKFGLPEVKRGLVAVGGGLFRLPTRLPYPVVMELALTGELIGAHRLQELGLISRVVEPGEALNGAIELAERIAANAPLAVTATKQILRSARDWTEAEAWTEQRKLARTALTSQDAKEGARAFAEKRPPVWRGV
jgi:enoyl-CoA hydratase/carnithine racemase